MDSVEQRLAGWGNMPVERCLVTKPESLERLRATITNGDQSSYIARGLGRAYGDSSLNEDRGVVVQTRLNRLIDFDPATGLLTCEAGVSLGEIIDVFLPRGWFLPTTPGTKFVTVGGAIAADVHGKNHHSDGTFGQFVESITLMIGDGSLVTCTPTEDPELFWATIGGMGLTGVIITASFRLRRVESAFYEVTYKRLGDLDATFAALKENEHFQHSVAWIDCVATGKNLGRSVLMLSNDTPADALPKKLQKDPLRVKDSILAATVPFDFPAFTLNEYSVRAFNMGYYNANSDGVKYEHYDKFWYPLDAVKHWNRIYGERGFVQYQALLPHETSHDGFKMILERIAQSRRASFLAVFKICGKANPSPLSYLHEGHTLALDLAYTDDLPELAADLDRMLLDNGGRLYLAKDALTTPEAFRQMYPRLDEFREVKARVDPNQRFVSSQARRLGIVEDR